MCKSQIKLTKKWSTKQEGQKIEGLLKCLIKTFIMSRKCISILVRRKN
jgi:hypothetical protein